MRIHLTSVEKLDWAHPGLELDVCLMLDQNAPPPSIQAMLEEKYKVEIPLSTLSHYKQVRYLPEKEYWEKLLKDKEATLEVVRKHGADAVAEASIMEQLDEARRRGERASMKDLLRESRERVRLKLEKEQLEVEKSRVENEKKALELKIAQLERQQEQAKQAVKEAVKDGQKDPKGAIERILGIYGLGVPGAAGAPGPGPAPAVPEAVGGG